MKKNFFGNFLFKNDVTENKPFDNLPLDLLPNMFGYMNTATLSQARLVCKQWNKAIMGNNKLKEIFAASLEKFKLRYELALSAIETPSVKKVLVLGEVKSGTSSLMYYLMNQKFPQPIASPSVGLDIATMVLNDNLKVQLYSLSLSSSCFLQEITRAIFKELDLIIVCRDGTKPQEFEKFLVDNDIAYIRENTDVPILIVSTKLDAQLQRYKRDDVIITLEQTFKADWSRYYKEVNTQKVANILNYIACSSKTGDGMNYLLAEILWHTVKPEIEKVCQSQQSIFESSIGDSAKEVSKKSKCFIM